VARQVHPAPRGGVRDLLARGPVSWAWRPLPAATAIDSSVIAQVVIASSSGFVVALQVHPAPRRCAIFCPWPVSWPFASSAGGPPRSTATAFRARSSIASSSGFVVARQVHSAPRRWVISCPCPGSWPWSALPAARGDSTATALRPGGHRLGRAAGSWWRCRFIRRRGGA
jgi:hypothetical protein